MMAAGQIFSHFILQVGQSSHTVSEGLYPPMEELSIGSGVLGSTMAEGARQEVLMSVSVKAGQWNLRGAPQAIRRKRGILL